MNDDAMPAPEISILRLPVDAFPANRDRYVERHGNERFWRLLRNKLLIPREKAWARIVP